MLLWCFYYYFWRALSFHISILIFCTLFISLVFDSLLQSIYFQMFCSNNSITSENMYPLSCWFHCVDIFWIKYGFGETGTATNSMTRILLIETQSNFRTIKCCVIKCYPSQLSCVSHSINIFTLAIKNIRNMHAVSTNQIADFLHFNDNYSHTPTSV